MDSSVARMMWLALVPAGQAHDGAAGIGIPVGSAQAGKGRDHIDVVGGLRLVGEVFRIPGIVDASFSSSRSHWMAEPPTKNGAFQSVAGLAAGRRQEVVMRPFLELTAVLRCS